MVRRRRLEKEFEGGTSPAATDEEIAIALLSTPEEWFFLRVDLHPHLKGRLRLGDAERLSLRRLVQLHALLDKVDKETAEQLEKLKKQSKPSKFRR